MNRGFGTSRFWAFSLVCIFSVKSTLVDVEKIPKIPQASNSLLCEYIEEEIESELRGGLTGNRKRVPVERPVLRCYPFPVVDIPNGIYSFAQAERLGQGNALSGI